MAKVEHLSHNYDKLIAKFLINLLFTFDPFLFFSLDLAMSVMRLKDAELKSRGSNVSATVEWHSAYRDAKKAMGKALWQIHCMVQSTPLKSPPTPKGNCGLLQ